MTHLHPELLKFSVNTVSLKLKNNGFGCISGISGVYKIVRPAENTNLLKMMT